MKRPMFVIIACTMALSGCSSKGGCTTVNPQPEENATEVKLSADILSMATRVPVSTDDNITTLFATSTTNGDYTMNTQSFIVTFVASPTSMSALSFSSVRYYPINSSTIYTKSYCPAGTPTGKSVTLIANGTENVMIIAQASGTKATAAPLPFIFNHLLTQLQFKFVSGMGYPASGVNVTSLVIKQQKAPTALNLNTTTMMYTTKDLTFSGTFLIMATETTVSNYPVARSGEAPSVAVIISDGVVYPETATSIATEVGESHLITLTFTPKEITAAISVIAWQIGGRGSSSL